MTPHATVPATPVLNLTEWSRQEIEHPDDETAWAAYYADRDALLGKEVYITEIETGECSTIQYDRPVKARVTDIAGDEVNMNYDSEWYYIDPFVDVELLETCVPEGARFTYGRSHRWRRGAE